MGDLDGTLWADNFFSEDQMATKPNSRTKLKNPITGIIHVTGEPDTGKTDFALSCGYQPSEMFIVDDDIKTRASLERAAGPADVNELFPMYFDFIKLTEGRRELETHAIGLDLIDKAIALQPKVFIWDTWTRFAKTCHPFVVKNAEKFREFWSHMGTIKGGEQWAAAFQYEAMLYQKLLKAAPLVILVTHLKDDRLNGVKTGKQIPDAQRPLLQKATLRLFLRHNAQSAAPVGLVLKRLEKWVITEEEGMQPISVLPRRLQPCTWKKIREYWENPLGDRAPTEEETPNAFELSILDGTLTQDQKDIFKAGLLHPDEESAGVDNPLAPDTRIAEARALKEEGKTNLQIAKALSDKYNKRVMPTEVVKWLNASPN